MSRTSIIALLIFGAILGYFLSFGADTTRKFQSSVYQMLAPFFTTGSGLQKQITSVRTGLKSLEELEKENASLRVDNRQLRATNSALRDVEHEINRGKEDHIETDMPVVTDEGLVGKTTTVSNTISIVLLVTDENCKVAASVEGTREQGIVSGERVFGGLAPLLDLNFLTKQANLQPGQKAYTSGVGGVFPSGLFLGTVKSFRARELDGQAKVAPAVDLSHLEDVFVVTGRK